jgi:hypothetical protein
MYGKGAVVILQSTTMYSAIDSFEWRVLEAVSRIKIENVSTTNGYHKACLPISRDLTKLYKLSPGKRYGVLSSSSVFVR